MTATWSTEDWRKLNLTSVSPAVFIDALEERDRYRKVLELIVGNLGSPSYQANPEGNQLLLDECLRRAREALTPEKKEA